MDGFYYYMVCICSSYTCQLFWSEMRENFRLHSTSVPKDLPKASEDCQRFPKTFEDHGRPTDDLRRLPKFSWQLMICETAVLRTTWKCICWPWHSKPETCHVTQSKQALVSWTQYVLWSKIEDTLLLDSPFFAKKNSFLFNQFLSNYSLLSVRHEKLVWMHEITIFWFAGMRFAHN